MGSSLLQSLDLQIRSPVLVPASIDVQNWGSEQPFGFLKIKFFTLLIL
jgi:hypothetical protein